MDKFADFIRGYREGNKLKYGELGDLLGVKYQTIQKWEKGETMPRTKDLGKIAEKLGVNLTHLISVVSQSDENATNESHISVNRQYYYPDAQASAGLGFLSETNVENKMPISIPNVRADVFINVFGDSMYPMYCAGEIIGIKEISKDMVFFGHAYVVQMTDSEAYIKFVKKGRDEDHWVLASENPKYDDREFHLSKIDRIYIIKAVISRKSLT